MKLVKINEQLNEQTCVTALVNDTSGGESSIVMNQNDVIVNPNNVGSNNEVRLSEQIADVVLSGHNFDEMNVLRLEGTLMLLIIFLNDLVLLWIKTIMIIL